MMAVTRIDAWAYCELVRKTFHRTPEKFNEFLNIMRDYKAKRCPLITVMLRAEDLFEGQADLIKGFNKFLPDGYQIIVSNVKKPKNHIQFPDALRFVNKVKARFQGGVVYKGFLDILNRYKAKPLGDKKVYEQVASLFGHDHRDLAQEFARFLPSRRRRRMSSKAVDDLSRLFSRL